MATAEAKVPAVGVLSYNNVTFGPFTKTTGVSIRPVEDSAGRTTVYNEYTISFESIIIGETKEATDAIANVCRKALTKMAAPFIMTGRGIGDIFVNANGITDVMNGPKPKVLSFEPATGGQLAAKLRWEITFCIPECNDAVYKFKAMEFTYSVSYQITNGYTTRSVTGKLRVPQNRKAQGVRLPQDSADYYRDQIVGEPPEGFRIVYGPFNLSEDRSTLTFSYQHVEMGRNPLPKGCVEADVSVTVSSAGNVFQWQMTFDGNFEVAKGGTAADAVNAFFKIVGERIEAVKANPLIADDVMARAFGAGNQKTQLVPLPVAMSMREPNIFGPHKVGISMTLVFVTDITGAMNSGIWRPVYTNKDKNSWRLWYTSLKDNAQNPRGTARLVFDIGEDRYVDLCDNENTLVPTDKRTPLPQQRVLGGTTDIKEVFPPPKPEQSWMDYKCSVTLSPDSGNVLVRTMPEKTPTPAEDREMGFNVLPPPSNASLLGAVVGGAANQLVGGGGIQFGGNNGLAGNQLQNDKTDMVGVRRAEPAYIVTIQGYALRAGHRVPEPSVKSIGGFPVVPLDRPGIEGFQEEQVAMSTVPLYAGRWRKRYGVVGDIGNIPVDLPLNILFPEGK